MQAVVLAGGLGTRLKPFTEKLPKVMVPVNGKPFLFHLLRMLKDRGIDNVVLCTGYLGGMVRDFFGDGAMLSMRIQYSEEKEKLLGTGGALKQAQSLLQRYFMVMNGDTYLPLNYRDVERAFIRSDKQALMVVYDNNEDTGVKSNVTLDGKLVSRYDKQGGDPHLRYVEAGVLVLSREVLELIPEGQAISLERSIYPILIARKQMAAYVTAQRFYDIGTPEQWQVFENYLQKERP